MRGSRAVLRYRMTLRGLHLQATGLLLDVPMLLQGAHTDLPGFFDRLISGKMALRREGRADEKEPIHR